MPWWSRARRFRASPRPDFLMQRKRFSRSGARPRRMQRAEPCEARGIVIDVASFGELGVVALRRDGIRPAPLPCGTAPSPDGEGDAAPLLEVARSALGTVMLRGEAVPVSGFPLGSRPHHASSVGGFIDTGYPCRFDAEAKSFVITAPPAGVAAVGSYRIVTRELERHHRGHRNRCHLDALPQELTGERIAGHRGRPRRGCPGTGAARRQCADLRRFPCGRKRPEFCAAIVDAVLTAYR